MVHLGLINDEPVFNPVSHLNLLLKQFGSFTKVAVEMHSPNAEDDEFIRFAMVGFAEHLSLASWEFEHFEYVRALRDEVMVDDFSNNWRRFTCLAGGYFLGMLVVNLISDAELRVAEIQVPGFMWLHSNTLNPIA